MNRRCSARQLRVVQKLAHEDRWKLSVLRDFWLLLQTESLPEMCIPMPDARGGVQCGGSDDVQET